MFELLVNIAELTQAAAKMASALANYREAIADVKTAADELASNWEGDGQVAFVNDQSQAYKWYIDLSDIVQAMIDEARRIADRYTDMLNEAANILKS